MKRCKPDIRKQQIVDAGVQLAADVGISRITRDGIAERVGVSGPAVQYHFKTVKQLQRAVKRAAVEQRCLPVIAQLIALGDSAVDGLPKSVAAQALRGLRVL